jgi:phosphohistidine swiveling domain-containing protein
MDPVPFPDRGETRLVMDRWITDWERGEPDWMPYYTRANAGETLPDPASPLGWTFAWEQGFVPGWVRGMELMGIYPEGEFPRERPAQLGMFGGYFYINLSHMRVMTLRLGGSAESADAAWVGSRADVPPYAPHPRDEDPEQSAKAGATVAGVFARTSWPEIDEALEKAWGRRAARPDLGVLRDAELVQYARKFQPELEQDWIWHVFSSLSASLGPGMLAGLAAQADAADLSLDLIAGLGDLESASPAQALWDLSRQVKASAVLSALFDAGADEAWRALQDTRTGDLAGFGAAFDEFTAQYGCRGPNEWDLYTRSWEVAPAQPLSMVASMRHSPDGEAPANRMKAQEERREAAARRMRELLAGAPDMLAQFDAALASAALCIAAREKTKLMCVLDLGEVRMAFLELGRRGAAAGWFAEPANVMMLLAGELDAYLADPASFAPVIAERLEAFRDLYDIEPPFVLTADPPPLAEWPRKSRRQPGGSAAAETVLTGLGGSPGCYTGRSRIITGLDEAGKIEPGDVLVAPFTDAAWTPLFLVAGAVVVDLGAINSHAMVVARELGIPCVVSVQDAASRIPDDALVTVDGTAGTVTIMAPPAGARGAAS